MTTSPRISMRQEDGVNVIRFNDHHLFDERTVRDVADQITAAIPNDGSPIRLILDFAGVELISSSLLSKLILLQRRIDGTGGKLRLCELSASCSRSSGPRTWTVSSPSIATCVRP